MNEIAVLIPTVNRAEKLRGLLENVHEATEVPHTVWFICERADQDSRGVLAGTDSRVIVGDFGSCARAMNAGFEHSAEPFVFTGNDDLRFHPGWDTAALAALEEPGKHLCGTNDGHGAMTCFALVRRSYIEAESGVFDEPSTLFHPYVSQFVDTELAEYAKHRGVWTEAPESITEHLHWSYGEADPGHPNYAKQGESFAADQADYLARKARWESAT